uniref:Uncharacterized protein n=2 Tax=Amphimedon queenslandica TaxID=400682 RepID=A0A1X7U9U7_AMPQE
PMHNFFLDTARHMMKNISLADSDGTNALLNTRDLEIIQNRVNSCLVPSLFGRIPYILKQKLHLNKRLVVSVHALYNIIGSVNLECWEKVCSCLQDSSSTILTEKVSEAHCLLIEFCKDESLYGKEATAMNMHCHTQLKECILDYGPLSTFWVFAFGRCNGYLGKFPTNNRSVEIKIMIKFCRDIHFCNLTIVADSNEEIPSFNITLNTETGTLRKMNVSHNNLSIPLCLVPLQKLKDVDHSLWSCI